MSNEAEKVRLLKRMIRYAVAGDKTAYEKANEQYRGKFTLPHGNDSSDACDLARQSCAFSMIKPDMRDAYIKDAQERLARMKATMRK